MLAAVRGDRERLFAALDADPEALKGGPHGSPLRSAAYNAHAELVTLLLGRGADPWEVNRYGYNAFRCAVEAGHAEVLAALSAAEKR